MAEGYFNRLIRQSGASFLSCGSAGVYADAGNAPSSQAVAVMKQCGIDISKHKSRPLSNELTATADLIVAMTQNHKFTAAAMFPAALPKTKTLAQFNDKNTYLDIADPFGGSVEDYKECFEEMKQPLENLFLDLLSQQKKTSKN